MTLHFCIVVQHPRRNMGTSRNARAPIIRPQYLEGDAHTLSGEMGSFWEGSGHLAGTAPCLTARRPADRRSPSNEGSPACDYSSMRQPFPPPNPMVSASRTRAHVFVLRVLPKIVTAHSTRCMRCRSRQTAKAVSGSPESPPLRSSIGTSAQPRVVLYPSHKGCGRFE